MVRGPDRGCFINYVCSYYMNYLEDIRRIVSCKSFRRLAYKTQVFANHEGDHFRTRLTHTIEVAALARTLAYVYGYDPHLLEAIALAHDLGHPPFGHSGEAELNNLCKEIGGFNHNDHTIRLITEIESWDGSSKGLGLSDGVLAGLREKRSGYGDIGDLINTADTVTYITHDIEDAIRAGVLTLEEVSKFAGVRDLNRREFLENIRERLLTNEVTRRSFRKYLDEHLYYVQGRAADEGREIIRYLFNTYILSMSPYEARDYIAGMTDRFAIKEAKRCRL